jgi:hypothetical protein
MGYLLQIHGRKFHTPKVTHLPRYEFRPAVAMKMQFMEYYAMLIYLPTFSGTMMLRKSEIINWYGVTSQNA